MNWKKGSIITIAVILIVTNFYLILIKESDISRSTYIDEWRTVKEQNLVLSKEKDGIVTPAAEEYVYFQAGIGDFGQFLVSEGEEVEVGTALFEYSPNKLGTSISQLEAEITRLENEQEAIEDNIDDLEKIERKLALAAKDEESTSNEAMASSIEAEIYEKEMALTRIEGEIEKYEELVSIADGSLDDLTVSSPISGVVKKINHDLQNPVVTIISSEKLVAGILDEEEMNEIEEGMKTIIYTSSGKKDGVISRVSTEPVEDAAVDKETHYQFFVAFGELEEVETSESDEEEEDETGESGESEELEEPDLLNGNHVDIKIITNEVEDALTLSGKAIKDGHIYVLKGDGTIETREVETGIKVNDTYEVTSVIEKGELVVYEPSKIRVKTEFFTPVEWKKVKKQTLTDMGKKEIFRYLGRGFLSS